MKKLISLLCAAALALSLAGCGTSAASGGETAAASTTYSLENATVLTFTDSGVTAQDGSDTGYEIDGTALTITGAGTYAVTGACADGSITVKKGTTGVTLVLNGLDLTSGDTAPITCSKSTQVTIIAADGSTNCLADSPQNNDDDHPDNENAENAVIKCKDGSQVTLAGTGSLTITANGKNGIKSGASTTAEGDASLTIRQLTLTIDAPVNDAINAEQTLNVESGTLTISAADDAIHSDLVLNIGAEDTEGPAITITECYEGLEGAELNIYSGDVSILSSDDCLNAANSDLSGYDFTMTISGGTVLAAGGSSGMGMNLTATQPCVTFGSTGGMGGGRPGDAGSSNSTLAKDAAFTITDSDGTTLCSSTALCNAAFLLFSSDALTADETCTLTCDDTTLTADAQSGTISSGMGGMGGGPGGMDDFQPGDGQQPPKMPSGGQRPQRPGSST